MRAAAALAALPSVEPCRVAHRAAPGPVVDPVEVGRRLRLFYDAATPDERREGLAFYPTHGRTLVRAALAAGLPAHAGPVVAATLSPRSPWATNLAGALALLADPTASTRGALLPDRVELARRYLAGAVDVATALAGPKVAPFSRNLAGDLSPVTVDVWAARAALGRSVELSRCSCSHATIGARYRELADEVGVEPATAQAVVWVVVRRAWVERADRATLAGEVVS